MSQLPSQHRVWATLERLRKEHQLEVDWFKALCWGVRRTAYPSYADGQQRPWRVWFYAGRERHLVLVTGYDATDVLRRFEVLVERRGKGAP